MLGKAKWRIQLWLAPNAECLSASIDVVEAGKTREIVVWMPGPFDSADEIVRQALDLVERQGVSRSFQEDSGQTHDRLDS